MPLAWVLELLAPLLKKWSTWAVLVLVALVLYIVVLRRQVADRDAALAARPRVETKVEVQTRTVRVAGPERVVEKVVAGAVVERVIYKDAVTTTTGTEKEYDRTVTPACAPVPARPWRYAHVLADPTAATKLVGLGAGVTLGDRLDLGVSLRAAPYAGAVEAGIRF